MTKNTTLADQLRVEITRRCGRMVHCGISILLKPQMLLRADGVIE
jgi:hypothetical protein